ncbi:MAG: VanW family protein [Clostridia bacterium]|nr:VanW family protein [Clostridia bacterium]
MSKKKQKVEETKEEKKDLIKVEEPEKPTLEQEIERKQKKNIFIFINIAILVFLIGIFSIIFALMNVTKSVIVNGVSIKGIDVSNLSMIEAKNKIEEALNIELNNSIKLSANEYETTLNTSQIEFEYNISKAVEDAYSVGRNGNIIQNNYEILKAAFLCKDIMPEYTYNKDTLNYIVDSIESKIPGLVSQATYYREGETLIITPGTDGIKVNKDKLKEEIINTIVNENAVEILQKNQPISLEIPIEQTKADAIDIEQIHKDIYTEPKDAYYEENPFKIYAEVEGVDFAISMDEAKGIIAENKEEYRIPLKITPANKTINDIGTEAFPYLISSFTTRYDASNVNRSQNLAIATSKINGTVLMPGEEFSFNQVVGKRTIEEGYKDAKIYQDGKVVDGLAGGICQISSTLYNAVVQANLEIVERRNHSFTTSYVKAGRDATVVYGVIDFKFKNTRTYPIKIEGSVNSGIAEFNIHGIKEEVEYTVDLAPVVTASIPYSTQYIPDPTLMPGQQVLVQAGGSGCKVTTYKETKLDGKLVSREIISTDTYQPMKAIIRVGP